jgi:hypothetical protein
VNAPLREKALASAQRAVELSSNEPRYQATVEEIA